MSRASRPPPDASRAAVKGPIEQMPRVLATIGQRRLSSALRLVRLCNRAPAPSRRLFELDPCPGAVGRLVDVQQEARVLGIGSRVPVGAQPNRAKALGRRGA